MSDIFDDVDSILDEEISDEEVTNFNENELHDIMSEIEDLEKEFEVEAAPMSLQEKIDAELAMELEELNTVEVVEVDPVAAAMEEMEQIQESAKVVKFEKMSLATPASTAGVSFQAQGQMSLNLDFMVGQESAKLIIDPVKGLIVTLSGVELCINEDSGCTIEMENGMKFTIPLSSQANSLKKKAA